MNAMHSLFGFRKQHLGSSLHCSLFGYNATKNAFWLLFLSVLLTPAFVLCNIYLSDDDHLRNVDQTDLIWVD